MPIGQQRPQTSILRGTFHARLPESPVGWPLLRERQVRRAGKNSVPSYSNQIVNYELLITNYRCESQKSLQRYRKITNSLLGITIFKDFKFRERELFWSLRSLGFPENYSRWPENLFQKIIILNAKTQRRRDLFWTRKAQRTQKKIIKS